MADKNDDVLEGSSRSQRNCWSNFVNVKQTIQKCHRSSARVRRATPPKRKETFPTDHRRFRWWCFGWSRSRQGSWRDVTGIIEQVVSGDVWCHWRCRRGCWLKSCLTMVSQVDPNGEILCFPGGFGFWWCGLVLAVVVLATWVQTQRKPHRPTDESSEEDEEKGRRQRGRGRSRRRRGRREEEEERGRRIRRGGRRRRRRRRGG